MAARNSNSLPPQPKCAAPHHPSLWVELCNKLSILTVVLWMSKYLVVVPDSTQKEKSSERQHLPHSSLCCFRMIPCVKLSNNTERGVCDAIQVREKRSENFPRVEFYCSSSKTMKLIPFTRESESTPLAFRYSKILWCMFCNLFFSLLFLVSSITNSHTSSLCAAQFNVFSLTRRSIAIQQN